MTREDAIKELKDNIKLYTPLYGDVDRDTPDGRLITALEMAIKALENHDIFMKRSYSQGKHDALSREPCEDAISRENAIIQISWDFPTLELPKIKESLDKLPPVTQKSGKWLITPMSNIAYCSECDYLFKDIPASIVKHFKHCPCCGAKMESEDV